MQQLQAITAEGGPSLMTSNYLFVDLANEGERLSACEWWREQIARGGERMVVKPIEFLVRGGGGMTAQQRTEHHQNSCELGGLLSFGLSSIWRRAIDLWQC